MLLRLEIEVPPNRIVELESILRGLGVQGEPIVPIALMQMKKKLGEKGVRLKYEIR